MRPESLAGVYLTPDLEAQKNHGLPPFIVFQTRITPEFEIEQMGDGFPCNDEAHAKELMKTIEARNVTVPRVMMANWAGYFGLVTMTNFQVCSEGLELFVYHKPKEIDGQFCKFSLKYYRTYLGKSAEILNEEFLPTTDPQIANRILQEKAEALRRNKKTPANAVQPKSQIGVIADDSGLMMESRFLVLSNAFPETIALMRKADISTPQEVYDAFNRDMFALTGKTDEHLLLSQQKFEELAKRIRKNRRNKQKGIDPIEFELVGGWLFKGYANMTPEQRREALQKLGLNPPSAGAINKICLRLKLPRFRKPGKHS